MTKLLSISILGILLSIGNPIEGLKVNEPPTKEQAQKLNRSNEEYEVFLNNENKVEYRDYEYRRVRGAELPFEITPKKDDRYAFEGRQVNLKVDTGWLVGFDKGEYGGNLFWFNEEGTNYEKIASGNIKNLFEIDGQIFVTEGLAHLSISYGQIFKVERKNNEWRIEKKVDLPNAPYATTLTKNNEFLIVTSKGLLKVNKKFEIETLVEEGFWRVYLYPNSILVDRQNIYIGMRGGVLRTQMDKIENQQWLTKK
jgi:hypothetical protein